MYSFEGQFKRKPQQSFGGASRKVERNELLNRAIAERHQREKIKRRNQAATSIQAFYRKVSVRTAEQRKQRLMFDESVGQFNVSNIEKYPHDFGNSISRLLFFYNGNADIQRLFLLTKLCVQSSPVLIGCLKDNPAYWLYKVQKLAQYCVSFLKHSSTSNFASLPLTIPLRFIEVFTSYDSYASSKGELLGTISNDYVKSRDLLSVGDLLDKLWSVLVSNSYFEALKVVLEQRVPSSLPCSAKPPTPIATTLLDLFLRPFQTESALKTSFLRTLFLEVFGAKFSPQVRCFLLPAFTAHSNMVSTDIILQSLYYPGCGSTIDIPPSIWIMHTVVQIMSQRIAYLSPAQIAQYLQVLVHFVKSIPGDMGMNPNNNADSDSEESLVETSGNIPFNSDIIKEMLDLINQEEHINAMLSAVESKTTFQDCIGPVCSLGQVFLNQHRRALCDYRLLYTLAFRPSFLRLLWNSIISSSNSTSVFHPTTYLLQYLSQGIFLSATDQEIFLPQVTMFCALLNHMLSTLHDFEFYGDKSKSSTSMMPFSLDEMASICLILRDVCLGLIDLAYPENRPTFNEDYIKAMQSVGVVGSSRNQLNPQDIDKWNQLLKYVVVLLRQLYSRDSRQRFCPEGQWISKHFSMSFSRAAELHFSNRKFYGYEPFVGLCHLTRQQLEDAGPPPSAMEVRQIAILQEFPFVICFRDRVKIFQSLIAKDKEKNQGYLYNFQMGPQIHALIRRNYIYEDAFDNLSPQNQPNLKLKLLIQLVNAVGLDEVGIDGGGIFREFLNELLKTCFDPNRGFFKTTHDCLLYPNPGVSRIFPNFSSHYYFIGRMLGKAIYENMLVELPFAGFFLAKILAQQSSDVDIHHLASLDPVMYRNLLYLKTYSGDIRDLGLDFTVMSSELGTNEVIELKTGGANIPVTENNCIAYIHLMSDFKLNKQIKAQCQAFKEGLANVIDLEWLYMFDPNELQVLISGAHVPIDINDLKANTNYAGGYTYEHPVIQVFWKVVENFNEQQRRQLLKFVTSCSRPPLLGFKELAPAFCIQNGGHELHRLPTASTCMNLLKLPEFEDEETLKTKLLYAIESESGFELS